MTPQTNITPLVFSLSLLAFILSLPLALLTITLFAIYREIIRIILKIRHGPKFVDLLDGNDVSYTIDDPAKSTINCLLILECDDTVNDEEYFETLRKISINTWFKNSKMSPKSKCTIQSFMGYSYRLSVEINPDQCIRKLRTISPKSDRMSKTEFMDLVNEVFNSPLPEDNKILWEILIGTQPVNWREDSQNGKTYYPFLFRVHHSIADGVALLKFMSWYYGLLPENIKIAYPNMKTHNGNFECYKKIENGEALTWKLVTGIETIWFNKLKKLLSQIGAVLYILVLFPASFYFQLTARAVDKNITPLNEKKTMVLNYDENSEYLNKIKRIKAKIKDAAFSDILLTAFCASLSDYYHQKILNPPQNFSAVVPIFPGSTELRNLIPGCPPKGGNINFCNGFSLVIPVLPVSPCNQVPLLHILKLVMEDTKSLKESVDFYVNSCIIVLFGLIPKPLVKKILDRMYCRAVISIIAGPPAMNFNLKNVFLKYLMFWSPHHRDIGMSFCSITYGDRLHIMFSADTALIAERDSVQAVLDGVFKKLDLLEEEIKRLS